MLEATQNGWGKILGGLVTVAIIGLVTATINHSQRLAILEAGPNGSEIITRLVTIETQLMQIRQTLDEERSRRRDRFRSPGD